MDDSLLSNKVDEILSERKYDHIEAWRCLEVVFLIVFLLLREESCKSQLLIVSWD